MKVLRQDDEEYIKWSDSLYDFTRKNKILCVGNIWCFWPFLCIVYLSNNEDNFLGGILSNG